MTKIIILSKHHIPEEIVSEVSLGVTIDKQLKSSCRLIISPKIDKNIFVIRMLSKVIDHSFIIMATTLSLSPI